jgi:DNA repair protein RecN (Recombination protein N)
MAAKTVYALQTLNLRSVFVMLQKLYIRNYAIIDELNIDFDPQLNVITGETGAGKSIILGALSLILGERAETSVLINRAEKCVVEAFFNTKDNKVFQKLLQREELDAEENTIIRRELSSTGKSRAFINDTPVTLAVLNELTSALVDLHRQFDNRSLHENRFLYEVTDAIADNQLLIPEYQEKFRECRRMQQELQQLLAKQEAWRKESDYKQFLFEELEQAALQENELEEAAQSLRQVSGAEQIKQTLQTVYGVLEEGDRPLNHDLKKLVQQLQSIVALQPAAAALAERLESALIELRDIAQESERLQQQTDVDPAELERLQLRLDIGYKLLKKHGLQQTHELIALQQQLASELAEQSHLDSDCNQLQQSIATRQKELQVLAHTISERRKAALPSFTKKINELLALVGMPNATFKIAIENSSELHLFGADELQFLFDGNKSGKFVPVHKAASGGEISRIMLCIKTITAKALELPSIIFDEVDAGISGEAARQVGRLLRSLSEYHQVLCITHQPQVAAKGSRHYFVFKKPSETGQIKTSVKLLNTDERIKAIAEMIGGEQPSVAAIENARELVTEA